MNKNDVLSLRDFALAHLPKVCRARDDAASGGRLAAERTVAFSHDLTMYSPASTAIEMQASRLLYAVGTHPDTHVERLIAHVDFDDSISLSAEQAVTEADQNREAIEENLLVLATELCRISGHALPAPIEILLQSGKHIKNNSPYDPTIEKRAAHDITTERGVRRRILEHWDKVYLLHRGTADGKQVVAIIDRYRQKEDPEANLKTVQNTLIKLRNEGLIP